MGNPGARKIAATDAITAARTRRWVVIAGAAIGWALFTLIILHSVSGRNPVTDTLSSYAHSERGGGMLEASLLSLAVGAVAVLGALRATGMRLGLTTHILFGATALGLTLAAFFPATLDSGGDVASGVVHQYASLIAFLCLPGIGMSLRERVELDQSRILLNRICVVYAGGLFLFGLSYITRDIPPLEWINALVPVGFAQRITFGTGFALLGALTLAASRSAKTIS
ncbi:DUF998 domain-containing protein [Amycolatopsis magusensis]|uniref:DUF998 domain-containing protein n=1 Tax=Amycolatopsis magusensis TaxID=882444 RepID=A0ABS4PL80_9PSEU|nr:DUF998 domain-containing protein [Amycolatopsis magusensis]MBP2180187.1 hypothetical protein [Amycolatopsis magusensis]MDI5978784.1 DUF998 domain-containing protein [Amycolatopsis magusensis]